MKLNEFGNITGFDEEFTFENESSTNMSDSLEDNNNNSNTATDDRGDASSFIPKFSKRDMEIIAIKSFEQKYGKCLPYGLTPLDTLNSKLTKEDYMNYMRESFRYSSYSPTLYADGIEDYQCTEVPIACIAFEALPDTVSGTVNIPISRDTLSFSSDINDKELTYKIIGDIYHILELGRFIESDICGDMSSFIYRLLNDILYKENSDELCKYKGTDRDTVDSFLAHTLIYLAVVGNLRIEGNLSFLTGIVANLKNDIIKRSLIAYKKQADTVSSGNNGKMDFFK